MNNLSSNQYYLILFLTIRIQFVAKSMDFLQKFKGKTQLLKRHQVHDLLGQKSQNLMKKADNKNQLHLLSLAQNSSETKSLLKQVKPAINSINGNKSSQTTRQKPPPTETIVPQKKITQNPFLVRNEFFLDQQQHKKILQKRKQQQIKQRKLKQKKKRQAIQEKLRIKNQQLLKKNQKLKNLPPKIVVTKQWVKLGGLGPNIGGQQWEKKKKLQEKMLKFAQQIKKINLGRIQQINSNTTQSIRYNKSVLVRSTSKTNQSIDARTKSIKYSKSIPKPAFYSIERSRQISSDLKLHRSDFQRPFFQQQKNIQPQQTHEFNQFSNLKFQRNYSQLKKLESKHEQFKNLIYSQKF